MKTLLVILLLSSNLAAHEIANRIEPLLGVHVDSTGIEIQVESGGCTHKNSFAVKKRLNQRYQVVQLLFLRVEADTCEANWPAGRKIFFSYEDMQLQGGESFQVTNPLATHRVPEDIP